MTVLLSHTLFDYCGKYELERDQYDFEIHSSMDDLPLEKIEPEPSIVEDVGMYSCETFLQPLIEVPHDDFCVDVTFNQTSEMNDILQDTHDDVHSSASSGFILFDDDHFVTFDADHGACDWGVDMSLNADF